MTVREKRFFALVQATAAAAGGKFFMDCGEGRALDTKELEGEDFSGWLIPQVLVPEFEPLWTKGSQSSESRWDEFYTFAEWEQSGEAVQIRFNKHTTA